MVLADLPHAFEPMALEAAAFELNQPGIGVPSAQAWLAVIERRAPG
jgi:hypothetical protein